MEALVESGVSGASEYFSKHREAIVEQQESANESVQERSTKVGPGSSLRLPSC